VRILNKFFKRAQAKERLMVIGLDSVPLSLIEQGADWGIMPHMAELLSLGYRTTLETVIPTVGSVSWASYATGVNPGKHGVFGFVDRTPNPFNVHIPTADDLKVSTLWEQLSMHGLKPVVVGVPLTYPPKKINGIMVADTLSPDLAKATHPMELAPRLMEMDYRIDADLALAKDDKGAFLANLLEVMRRRFQASVMLLRELDWDFFHLHVHSADRLNYFFWPRDTQQSEEANQSFWAYYKQLDENLGWLLSELPEGTRVVLISQHGTCATQGLVYINQWLSDNGYLLFPPGRKELLSMLPSSKAYSLVPGRVYLNLQEREQNGSVPPGEPYEELRAELVNRLGALTHPETGQPLIARVHRREDLYSGSQVSKAADLILEPEPGFDLKANLDVDGLVGCPDLPGMHTSQGGFVFIEGVEEPSDPMHNASLVDLSPTFMKLLGVEPPPGLDGRSLI
jgi:predicted AlkP superfamily phosphohydrolase/phosphomutase